MRPFLQRSQRLVRAPSLNFQSSFHPSKRPHYLLCPCILPIYQRSYASRSQKDSQQPREDGGDGQSAKAKALASIIRELERKAEEVRISEIEFETFVKELQRRKADRIAQHESSQKTSDPVQSSDPKKSAQTSEEGSGVRPGLLPLNNEENDLMDELIHRAKIVLSGDQAADFERIMERVRKHGISPELREELKAAKKGSGFSILTVAKLTRHATKLINASVEEDMRARAEEEAEKHEERNTEGPQQKAGAHDPGPQKKRDGKQQKGGFEGPFSFKLDASTIVTTAFVTYLVTQFMLPGENSKEITWQEFRTSFLDKGLVEKITVLNGHRAKVYLHREAVGAIYPESPAVHRNFYYYFTLGSVEAFERRMDEAQQELGIPSSERIPVAYQDEVPWFAALLQFGPTLLFIGAILWLSRRAASGGGGQSSIFGMGRSRAKRFNHETDIKVKFADVAGMDEAKQEIMEFVSFLKEPGIYQKLGAKIPRGAILSGPPGTGKTLLAKATAGESAVPFFSVSGSEFVEMFVGVGPSRVRDLFATARKNTPCIIFIDEIDAIGKSRSRNNIGGGNDERESTLNQILTEMDGFNTSEQVVVMAGTNRPDILDKALLRPGRFDRHIAIDMPTMAGRKQIFAVHLKKVVTNEDMAYLQGRLAALTPGFSGADIANCVNEAALIAARNKAESITMQHFEQAIERVIGGLERKSMVLSPEEKKTVAYHEAGHAICGWYFKYADPLLKVSIIPRGKGALGYAQYLPTGDAYLLNVNQMMDRMAMTLGGRVSEELHFDSVTSGASDDFKKVTQIATAMVTRFGMSRKIGYVSFEDDSQQQLHKPFSEETAKNIDAEVRRIVEEAYKQCRDLLTEKKAEVGIVAEELLKKEMLSRDDMVRLLGPRPFEEKDEFSKYFGGGAGKSGEMPTPPGLPEIVQDEKGEQGGGQPAPTTFSSTPKNVL